MKLLIFTASAVALLAGCDSRPIESLGYAERMQLAQEITDRCVKLGIDPKSAQMVDCQNAEVEKEVARREAWATGHAAAGSAMQSYASSRQDYLNNSGPLRCTSSPLGNSVNTTCY